MNRTEIIAEIGSVHDGSFGNALKLIDLAADVGADTVKFQMHIADAESLPDAPMPPYFKGEPRFEYFERTAFSNQQWADLIARANSLGLGFLCSAFSMAAVERLEQLCVTAHKVASGEVTNIPMLEAMGRTGKPVYISSGMSTWSELDAAVEAVRGNGGQAILLQCTSKYPCPVGQVGLNILDELKARFSLPVGLSDHTLSPTVAALAVAKGAVVIEKHLTFSQAMYGSDAAHSLPPEEFRRMVAAIREAEVASSETVDKDDMAAELAEMKGIFQKSVVAVVNIPKDAVLDARMIGIKKPGGGIPPSGAIGIIGRRARKEIEVHTTIFESDLI